MVGLIMYRRPNPKLYNPASRVTGHPELSGRELEALKLLTIFEENKCKFKGETGEFIERFYKPCDDLLCEEDHAKLDTRGITANELFWLRDIYYRRKKLFNAPNKGEHHHVSPD
jgi:hypothetical protein